MDCPIGQCQVIYIRKDSDIWYPLGPDPTMHYVADKDFEMVIANTIKNSYRDPDIVEYSKNGKIACLKWLANKEEWTTKPRKTRDLSRVESCQQAMRNGKGATRNG